MTSDELAERGQRFAEEREASDEPDFLDAVAGGWQVYLVRAVPVVERATALLVWSCNELTEAVLSSALQPLTVRASLRDDLGKRG